MIPRLLVLALLCCAGELLAQTLGNVWHLARNVEPAGVQGMRNPPYGNLSTNSATFYNGSYSLDGDQSGGALMYRRAGTATWSTVSLGFDSQSGNNKYWRATIPANTFAPGDTVEYYFKITLTDRSTTYLYGTDTNYVRTVTESVAQQSPFSYRVTLPWPGGVTAGYPSDPADRIWHWKEEAVVGNGYITVQLDQNGSLYDIYYPSPGNRQGVSTANEGYRGPEEFPNCALDQQANGQMNVINGMAGIGIGGAIYWMKNTNGADYTSVSQAYVTNQNVVLTSSRLNIAGNSIGIAQLDFCPVPAALPIVSGGGRTNYGVYIKRLILTNLESTARTIDFYYDVNFNVNGGNDHDVMYFDSTSNQNTMVVYDNVARTVSGTGCGPNGTGTEYNPASYGGGYTKSISVFFGTALKLVTNSATGFGTAGEASWRDHSISDNQEGWLAKRVTLPPGQPVEIDVLIVGSWDNNAGATGTHDYWGRPIVQWFYTNSMAAAQTTTEAYWSNWLASGVTVQLPDDRLNALWNRSLLVSALHIDAASGAIIAGMHNGAYPFVWPRDGVYAAITLARTGHTNESYAFYRWLRDTAYRDTDSGIGDKGFFYQKYSTDGYRIWTSPQVDETASVPWGIYFHYLATGDTNFLNQFWNLVYTAARASSETSSIDGRLNFNNTYHLMDGNNVWEDSFALFDYSNASVIRGLRDAAAIGDILGQGNWANTFRNRAATIKSGLDARIDSRVEPSDISHLGMVVPYEVYAPTDPRMTNMIEWLHGRQTSGGFADNLVEQSGPVTGLVRRYNHSVGGGVDNYWNGGPWFLATAWYGEYYARWQDYLPGRSSVDVSRDKLNLMLAKLGPVGLGAEQIAPTVAAQKYPGFWLQTAWPNVWESHSTFLDQMMMFLDFAPRTNNTVSFAPKLPTGWTNIVFDNLFYRGHRLDVAARESSSSTRLEIVKRTAGPLQVDAWLRIPAGQSNVVLFLNSNALLASALNFDTNTGRAHIVGALADLSGTNTLAVTFGNADTDGDGLPDAWEVANNLDPLSAAGVNGASGDVEGDGFDNYSEFVAGTDPRNASSLIRVVSASEGGRTLRWSSVPGRSYQVFSATNVPSTFAPLSSSITATSTVTTYKDTNSAAARRFYRVLVQ